MTIRELFSAHASDTCAFISIRDRRCRYLTIEPNFSDPLDPDLNLLDRVGELRIEQWWISCSNGQVHIVTDQILPLCDNDLEVIYR